MLSKILVKKPLARRVFCIQVRMARISGFQISEEFPQQSQTLQSLPPYSDPRIVAQRSCFTLFGKRIDGFSKDGKEIVCDCCGRRIRNQIIIDGTKKNDLRRELAKIGVTSATIYPSLEGVAKELNQEFYK